MYTEGGVGGRPHLFFATETQRHGDFFTTEYTEYTEGIGLKRAEGTCGRGGH